MIPDPKAMRKAIMIAKSIASKVDPNFGRVAMPGVDQVLERAEGGGVTDDEAEKLAARYGPKQVPDAVDMLAKKLRELGANPKIGKPYTTPYGTSVYLYPSEVINADTPHLRISDHSGGWGANRGPVKPGGFNLGTEMSEAELNAAVDAAISSPSGRAFWDADNLKAETTAAYQAAVDQSRATAPERALAYYIDNIRNGRRSAATGARSIYGNFKPPAPPAKPKAPDPVAQDLGAKYGLPEFTTDLTPAQIEANKAAFLEGSKAPHFLYHGAYNHDKPMGSNTRPLGDIDKFDRHAAFKAFNRPEGMDAIGSWLSETPGDEKSERPGAGLYASPSSGSIYKVHANIKNPWMPRDFDHFLDEMHLAAGRDPKVQNPRGRGSVSELRDKLIAAGHDGIYFPGGIDHKNAAPTWIAFDPNQIKSAVGNNGQFDPSDPDIRRAQGGDVEDHGKTVPESPRTLELQRQMLMQGKRKAMLYTPGTPIPPPIHGIVGVRTPQGVIHYNPNLISHEEVVHAAQNNRLNEILGLGPYSKRDVAEKVAAGEPLLAVVSRDHTGHEAVAAAGTPSTAHEQLAALHEHVPEGGSVSVEPFDHVVSQRTQGPIERAQGGEVDDDSNDLNDMGLYSHAAEAAAALPQAKGTGQQMLASLKGVKPEEMKWSGANDKFADRPSVTKDELAQHFKSSMPNIQETVLKEEPPSAENNWSTTRGAKFSQHTIPGGKNYREVLMQLPKRQNEEDNFYHHEHWGDKANVLAHLRLSDRQLPDGSKALHMEELQSDWAQRGRKEGFATAFTPEERLQHDLLQNERAHFHQQMRNASDDDDEAFDRAHRARQEVSDKIRELSKKREGLPSAPYVTNTNNWTDLGLKRALIEAARGGHDKLIWTPGEEQAERYDISKHIGDMRAIPVSEDHVRIVGYAPGDEEWSDGPIFSQQHHIDKIDNVVGKEVAQKIRERIVMPGSKTGHAVYNPASGNAGPVFATPEEAEQDRQKYPNPSALVVAPHTENKRGKPVTLSNADLKVGGKGMKGYYDDIVPKRLLALAREHDPEAKIGSMVIPGNKTNIGGMPSMYREEHPVHSLDITPKMRESILSKGFKSFARGGDVEPEHMAVGGDAGENPLMKTFSQENAPSVIVSPRPGEGGGPPISPEKGFSYNPELESDHEPWNFSTPNIMGAPKPPTVQHPTMNQPRLKNIADSTGKIFKTKGFQDLAHSLTGLRGITATPTMGTWKNKAEPSFILHHPDMTDEHAHTLANVLGFGFQQDAAVQTKHNPDGEDGIQTLLIGHDKKLQKSHIDRMLDAAKDHGLDFTVTKDGKAAKFMHFGDEGELPNFIDKVLNIADRSGIKNVLSVQTQGDLIHAKDYLPNIFSKAGAQQGNTPGSEGSPDIFRGIVNHVLAPYAKAVAGEGYRLSPDRLAETYGLSDEQREHVRGALYPSKGADQSTVPLMTGEENLDVRPTGDRGKSTVGDALYALQNRAAQKGQIEPGDFSDRAKDQISNNIVKEVAYHVKNSDKSAIGWYDAALKKAMEEHSNNFPELKTDPNKQLLFKSILGITSQGNDVFSNSNHTARLYNRITRDGMSIPEAVKNLSGTFGDKTRAIESNLLKFHHLVENNGYDGIRDMFNQTKTVGEWNKILRQNKSLRGPDGSPLSMQGGSDQKVTGWMVFGPKIGSFINNLNGDYSTLTADLWFSRTWNRLLGHNFDHTPMAEAKQYREFRDALRGEFHGTSPDSPYLDGNPFGAKTSDGKPNIKADGEPEPWLMGPDARELSHDDYEKTLNDPEKMLEYAKEIHGRYKGGGYKVKSDLRRRAKNWIENREVPVAAPRGDRERSFQQDTVEQAQKTLKKKYGLNISVADIQAALWFHEKELFGKLGVASEKAQPADYHDAAIGTSKLIKSGDLYKVKSKEKRLNPPPEDQVFARGGLVDKALRIVASKVR